MENFFVTRRMVAVFLTCCVETAAMGGNLRRDFTALAASDQIEDTWSLARKMKSYMHRGMDLKTWQPDDQQEGSPWHRGYLAIFFVAAICIVVVLPGIVMYRLISHIDHEEEEDKVATEKMQNTMAKDLRRQFTKECTDEEEKKKYISSAFNRQASKLFEDIDTDNNGVLDLSELKKPVQDYLGIETETDTKWWSDTCMKAFDENGDKGIQKEEFVHLLRCLQFKRDKKFQPYKDAM